MNTAITSKYFTTYPFLLFLSISQSVFSEDLKFPQRKQSIQRPWDSTTTVQLTVDVSRDKKQISKYLYGVNIANWCDGYYLDLCAPKLRNAGVSVVRLGATNMERYNYMNNRIFNVITRENQYIPISWESFTTWCRNIVKAEPYLQISVYGHVAGNGDAIDEPDYDHIQSIDEVERWVAKAGERIKFWGVGNEPWIGWKRHDYPEPYGDAAHGDQILNKDTSYEHYFSRFLSLASRIKQANPKATVLGPTSANWWLYWSNDYSPLCPVTKANEDARVDDPRWQTMSDAGNQWNQDIFPERGDDPEITGWETDQNRVLCQYLIRAKEHEEKIGKRVTDFMDVHKYIRALTDRDAIQEPRGLWQDGFASRDIEVNFSPKIETKLLKRFQNMVDAYYPGTELSFSEYDYFYWNGHPKLPQIAAIVQMDFLGFFAKMGVSLACNWYVGEPNQSGASGEKGRDSAGQAMFNERGDPNPKYWAFWLMSHYFRGDVVYADCSDWDVFSIHACQHIRNIIVFVVNKGDYDSDTGDFIADQPAKIAQIQVSGYSQSTTTGLQIKEILRFGMNDPGVVKIETTGVTVNNGVFSYEFQPLSIYTFVMSEIGLPEEPKTYLQVNPSRIDFGPYETGVIEKDGKKRYTVPIQITNVRQGTTSWSASESSPWLTITGKKSGVAKVTDLMYLTADRTDLSYGLHETTVTVHTSEGTVDVPVTVEAVPDEKEGEKRICDFETGSLAHLWNDAKPYSVRWWDGHGSPDDQNSPYLYNFSLDNNDKPKMGGLASLKIVFDRSRGDNENGCRYMSFGTYGHKNATANWADYESLQFDIKSDTDGKTFTKLLLVITDELGNRGKVAIGIKSYKDLLKITDGKWQTLTVPLHGVFYDWRYPEGQNGSKIQLDLSRIKQVEFAPWYGKNKRSGAIYLDNLRVVRTSNR